MRSFKKNLYTVLIFIFAAIFLVSAFIVGKYVIESKLAADLNNALADEVNKLQSSQTDPDQIVTLPSNDEVSGNKAILPEYATLYLRNSDMVGWIKIEGTKVNYPVMQTPNSKDYYLYRNFQKENSNHGSIYVREECDVFKPSDNLTIYGHHMKNGSMFANVMNYRNYSFYEDHKYITFDTLTEHHTYEVFAAFTTTATVGQGFRYHNFIDAATEADFDEFVATCKELSHYNTGITPEYGDKLITLSTCEYTRANGRFVVVARRID